MQDTLPVEMVGDDKITKHLTIVDTMIGTAKTITVPLGGGYYERTPGDITFHRQVDLTAGLELEVALDADGVWHFCQCEASDWTNYVWHFSRDWAAYNPEILRHPDAENTNNYSYQAALRLHGLRPTEAQRRAIVRWWMGIEAPYALGYVGMPVISWAIYDFPGGADAAAKKYGDGRQMLYA